MTSVVDAESLLAVDIGSVNTRALLFDAVDGQYHFLAAGMAASTWAAPFFDVGEGVHNAVQRLQEITSRPLLDSDNQLLIPTQADGAGVDRLVVTLSAGPSVETLHMGLLSDVSLESVQHLAATTYSHVCETVGLNDHRRPEDQVDAILHAGADVVIVAGGTEHGSTRSVIRLAELLLMSIRTAPAEIRPRVLYCGNQALAKRILEVLGRYTEVQITPNIRPNIDVEDLDAASHTLTRMVTSLRGQQMQGLETLGQLSAAPVTLTAYAMARLVRFLGKLYDPARGVLGVDLGASATALAAAHGNQLHLSVEHPFGLGAGLEKLLKNAPVEDILRWVPQDVSASEALDYLWQKTLFPASLPLTHTTQAIELAAARELLRRATGQMRTRYPHPHFNFESIFASGAVFAHASSPGQALLTLLDGLEPVGMTTLYVDPYCLMAALGAVASANAILPVQILESGAFQKLATVIAPLSDARPGTPILRGQLVYEDGRETNLEIKHGALVSLPLRHGQTARLHLEGLRGTVVDPQRRNLNGIKITGGLCGAVIDARGRPLTLPANATRRRELLLRWTQTLESGRPA